ncbi:MAG: ABC transporter permease [Candidatus Omnitrophica bacterium]|nr:ABC transporter permease [Candidatus Omnitrophota bacterium]MBI3009546.1 ABC transporter permease [Candidatus Omnitrophota bacterium]
MLTHLKELFRYRDLLLSLAIRDIKVRYRQTLLGFAWAVAQPLSYMLIFTIVFSKFGQVSSDGTPYPLFSYTGLVPWTFFATALSLGVNSVASNMGLVKKIYFPREVFPLGVILGCLVDFLVASCLIAGLMVFYHIPASPALVWLVWLIGLEVAFLISLSLLVSALNVFYRDIKYIVPLCVQLGLFVTPVIYSASKVPEHLQKWYMLNPMAVVIDGIRRVILHGQPPQLPSLLITTTLVVVLGFVSYVFFKRVEIKFADSV